MKRLMLIIRTIIFIAVLSCEKEKHEKQLHVKSDNTLLKINSFKDSHVSNKFDKGCIMTFSKKEDSKNEIILMQGTTIQHVIGRSIFIMKIDGTFQMFNSNDEKDIARINRDLIMAKITNNDYEVEIITHFQQNIRGSNLNKYYGTVKVRRKKDNCTNSIDYFGEMTC
ncbi:hypothetical protein SAMN05421796_11176 [Chryseobacterium piscicola]|uniref:Uncharacterized protein n=2 Tax=Chryseobacterium piscicola TaxID=551459 RepID=A0A1N7P6T4_9FLAO|nr:hypothetical protein [Chryseobacterium piscicola]PQA94258.1 hypothetical protein B0A70_07360 [Chryseobacterium piscicola]SIT06258.1 hypothetical protein SAMN05421796_11176 [Chryseobacterium piscicola]